VSDVVYLDTSAVLRAVLECGLSPEVERRLGAARFLITSRLSLIEAARAFIRLRAEGVAETVIADAAREVDAVWARCTVWELGPDICDLAGQVAPSQPLRTLDAMHLATFISARRRLGDAVTMLTADERLERAAAIV
jgi:predicted nucleic acid-binding protein